MDIETKIAKSKSKIILNHPFFAMILLGLKMKREDSVGTMGTDGEVLLYSENFVNELSQDELTFVLAHETLHCVFQHMTRRGDRCPNKWNIAADYLINDLLVNEGIGEMPKVGLLDHDLVAKSDGTTESIYNLLPDSDSQKQAGDASGGGSFDKVIDAAKTESEIAQKDAEMRVKIVQAKNAAKAVGKLSAGIERLVSDLIKPKVDWREVLRDFVTKRCKSYSSFAKPKRRFLANDLILAGMTGERLGKIGIGVDCSGSIDERVLSMFQSEINAIIEDTSPESIEIIYFDTEVLRRETLETDSPIELKPIGGGGTDFEPTLKAFEDSQDLDAVIMLTDLYGPCGDNAPSFPLLWISYGANEAPFGEVTEIKD